MGSRESRFFSRVSAATDRESPFFHRFIPFPLFLLLSRVAGQRIIAVGNRLGFTSAIIAVSVYLICTLKVCISYPYNFILNIFFISHLILPSTKLRNPHIHARCYHAWLVRKMPSSTRGGPMPFEHRSPYRQHVSIPIQTTGSRS